MKRVGRVLFVTVLLLAFLHVALASGYTDVTVSEAKSMIDSNPLLVILDVRTQSEYDSGHIRNTRHIPVSELEARLDELDVTDEILVYCKSGGRSATASQILADNGFLHVYNMLGGITVWKSEGYPTYVKYASIQEAINDAFEGDFIFVSSGMYSENLVLNKTVSLIGENKSNTVIDGMGTGTTVNMTADSVSLEEFAIRNSSIEWTDTRDSGILVLGSNCRLESNTISNNTFGILLDHSSGNWLGFNIVMGNRIGILIGHSQDNSVEHNIISRNEDGGINCTHSRNNTLFSNDISHNSFGIHLTNSTLNTVSYSTILKNGQGLDLRGGSNNNTLSRNTIDSNNGSGIMLEFSDHSLIFQNNLVNNTEQVAVNQSFGSVWDNGCEGNYWSNYNGTDLDSDGVGDTEVPWEGVDSYPLMNEFWNPADVNHDLRVDIFDAVLVCGSYGSIPSDPNWNPHCDIAEPYASVDIYDVVVMCGSYGEEHDND